MADLAKLLEADNLPPREGFGVAVAQAASAPLRAGVLLAHVSDPAPHQTGRSPPIGYFKDAMREVRKVLTQLTATDPSTFTDLKIGATKYLVLERAPRTRTEGPQVPSRCDCYGACDPSILRQH